MEQKIKEAYKDMVREGIKHTSVDGVDLVIDDNDPKLVHASNGVDYRVHGNKRLRVAEDKPEEPKKSKEPKKPKEILPAKIEKECISCGKTYEISKYTPYVEQCEDCRNIRKAPAEDETIKCDTCGEEFTRSRFNPYITTCPKCTKKLRVIRRRIRKHPKSWEVISGSGQYYDFTDFFNMSSNHQILETWENIKAANHTDES